MKRFLVGLIVAALAAVGFGSVGAFASNGATVNHFTAAYSDNGSDFWTCAGSRVVNKVSVKDSETCIISGATSDYSGTYSGSPTGLIPGSTPGSHWESDYDGATATSWTMTVTLNADGATYTNNIIAHYNS